MTKRSLSDDVETETVLKTMRALLAAMKKESAGAFNLGVDSSSQSQSPQKKGGDPGQKDAPSLVTPCTVDLFSPDIVVGPHHPAPKSRSSPVKVQRASQRPVQKAGGTPSEEGPSSSAVQANDVSKSPKKRVPGPETGRKKKKKKKAEGRTGCSEGPNVAFHLKGKVVVTGGDAGDPNSLDLFSVRRDIVCIFVQLGRLAPRRQLIESFPDFSEILARRRSSGHDQGRSGPPSDSELNSRGDGKSGRSLGNGSKVAKGTKASLSKDSSANAHDSARKKRRVSKEDMVKAALKRSTQEALQADSQAAKRRRRSSGGGAGGGKLNTVPVRSQLTSSDVEASANVSIHTSSLDSAMAEAETEAKVAAAEAKRKPRPRTGAEFMRDIIADNNADLYTSDSEDSDAVERRRERARDEEENVVTELALVEGKLQGKRRRRVVRKAFSESSSNSTAAVDADADADASPAAGESQQRRPLRRSPSSDIDLPQQSPTRWARSSMSAPNRTSPRYTFSQAGPNPTVFEGDDGEDGGGVEIVPFSQGSSAGEVLGATTAERRTYSRNKAKKNALVAIENVVTTRRRQDLGKKSATAADANLPTKASSAFVEAYSEEEELPDLIPDSMNPVGVGAPTSQRKKKGTEDTTSLLKTFSSRQQSNSIGSTTGSDNEVATEEIRGRLKELEGMLAREKRTLSQSQPGKTESESGPGGNDILDDVREEGEDEIGAAQARKTGTADRRAVEEEGEEDGSDEDLFGSTPQAKRRKRIRMMPKDSPDVTSLIGKAKKKLAVEEEEEEDDDEPRAAGQKEGEKVARDDDGDSPLLSAPPAATASPGSTTLDASAFRSFVVLATGLDKSDKDVLLRFSSVVQCDIRTALDSSVTHVVVNHDAALKAERTLKYLQAIAQGKMVVGVQWIRDCMRMKALLRPDQYEVLDETGESGPEQSRLDRAAGRPRIFQDFEFCLYGRFGPIPKEQLRQLLKSSGATVVRAESIFSFEVNVSR